MKLLAFEYSMAEELREEVSRLLEYSLTNLKNCNFFFLSNESAMESLHLSTHVIPLIWVELKTLSLRIDIDII